MSLKVFHIVFIVLSTVTAVGFGFWEIEAFRSGGGRGNLIIGILSLAAGVLLMTYGQWFLKKMRKMGLVLGAALGSFFASPEVVVACTVCFGDPQSLQSRGARMGVVALLAVVVPVLIGFALFFLYLKKKSARSDQP